MYLLYRHIHGFCYFIQSIIFFILIVAFSLLTLNLIIDILWLKSIVYVFVFLLFHLFFTPTLLFCFLFFLGIKFYVGNNLHLVIKRSIICFLVPLYVMDLISLGTCTTFSLSFIFTFLFLCVFCLFACLYLPTLAAF